MPAGGLVTMGAGSASGLLGGWIQGKGAKSAAQTESDAANRAADIQRQMFEEQRSDLAPWRQAGVEALSQLGNPEFQRDFTESDFRRDPGYAFRMQEGQKALERSAAARGGINSGGFAKALSRYGQDYASNEYQNAYNRFNSDRDRRFNRLSSLAGLGQNANSQIASAGQNYANNVGNLMTSAASAQGAAGIAASNGYAGALSGLGQNLMDFGSRRSQPNWMSQSISSLGNSGFDFGGDNLSGFKMPSLGSGLSGGGYHL